jgi:hypothetical protein
VKPESSFAPTRASPRATTDFEMVFCPGKTQDLKGEPIHGLNQTTIRLIDRKTFNATLRESAALSELGGDTVRISLLPVVGCWPTFRARTVSNSPRLVIAGSIAYTRKSLGPFEESQETRSSNSGSSWSRIGLQTFTVLWAKSRYLHIMISQNSVIPDWIESGANISTDSWQNKVLNQTEG